MIEKIRSVYSDKLTRIFIFFGIFLLVFSVLFYIALGRGAAMSLTSQTRERQLALAESGASTLEAFIQLFGRSLSTLALTDPDQAEMEEFVKDWEDTPIAGVILTDTSGIVVANASRGVEPDLGVDVSDRDYFVWAREATEGEYYVGEPVISRLGASKDKYIVSVASPIIRNGQFQGVLTAAVIIQEMSDKYLAPLKISDSTRVYLMTPEGTVLVGPFPELIGVNIIDYIRSSNLPGKNAFADIVGSTIAKLERGTLDIPVPDFETKTNRRFIIAYAPVNCCQGRWLLGIMIPAEDLTSFFAPFYFNQLAIIVIAFLVFIAISVRLARSQGFREGLLEHLKQHHKGENDLPE